MKTVLDAILLVDLVFPWPSTKQDGDLYCVLIINLENSDMWHYKIYLSFFLLILRTRPDPNKTGQPFKSEGGEEYSPRWSWNMTLLISQIRSMHRATMKYLLLFHLFLLSLPVFSTIFQRQFINLCSFYKISLEACNCNWLIFGIVKKREQIRGYLWKLIVEAPRYVIYSNTPFYTRAHWARSVDAHRR